MRVIDLNQTAGEKNRKLQIENLLLKSACATMFTGFIIMIAILIIYVLYTANIIKKDIKEIKKGQRALIEKIHTDKKIKTEKKSLLKYKSKW